MEDDDRDRMEETDSSDDTEGRHGSVSDGDSEIGKERDITNGTENDETRSNGKRKAISIIGPGKVITSRSLMDFMGVNGCTKCSLGIKKIRQKPLRDLEEKKKTKLVRLFGQIILKAAHAFIPDDPESLVNESMRDIGLTGLNHKELQRCLGACKKASMQKRLIRAVITGCVGGRTGKELLARDVHRNGMMRMKSTSRSSGGSDEDDSEEDEDAKVSRMALSRGRKWTGNFRSICRGSKEDWKHLLERGFIAKRRQRRVSIPDDTIMECVSFIFEPSNRQLLATGSKKVRCHDGTILEIPAVRRTKSRLQIYAEYVERKKQVLEPRKLARTTFMRIIRAVTNGQQQMKHCVDYCFGVLLFENFRTVSYIVEKRVTDMCKRIELRNQIEAVQDFLKHGYMNHIDSNEDPAHDSRTALVGDSWKLRENAFRSSLRTPAGSTTEQPYRGCAAGRIIRADNAVQRRTCRCDACLKCFQVIENVRDCVDPMIDGVGVVLDDAAHKLKLFIGHTIRCKVQNEVIDDVYRRMLEIPAETFAVLTMDYKMKYEPKKYRQKSSDWYGRKGISWHGTVVTFKSGVERRCVASGNGNRYEEVDVPVVKHKFYDHICRNTTEQSTFAVASIIELVARHIQQENPSIRQVVLRTDNAANYHNRVLPVVAPFIFLQYGIKLRSIVHNETQDGKGPADLHFAVVTRYVDRYIESLCLDVVTPMDLVNAINHGNGLKGTTAELFDVNMEHINMMLWKAEQKNKPKDSTFRIIGRCNIIEYCWDESNAGTVIAESRAYKYSQKVRWAFRVHSSTCISSSEMVEDEGDDEEGSAYCGQGSVADINGNGEELAGNEYGEILHEGNVLFEGSMTGVKLMGSGTSVREANVTASLSNRLSIRCKGNVGHPDRSSSAGIRPVDAEGYGAENLGDGEAEQSDDEFSTEESDTEVNSRYRVSGNCYYCRRCGQSYMEERDVLKHTELCTAHERSCHAEDRACRSMEKLIGLNQVVITTHPENNVHMKNIIISDVIRAKYDFRPEWAKRPNKGDTMGKNFMQPFKPAVKAMVERGCAEKGKKLSASQMQEQLKLSYPTRFDIPAVHNITSYVNSCLRLIRKDVWRAAEGLPPATGQYCMPEKYARCLEEIVRENKSLMPRFFEAKLLQRLSLLADAKPIDFPTKEQISRKVGGLKTKVRKETGAVD